MDKWLPYPENTPGHYGEKYLVTLSDGTVREDERDSFWWAFGNHNRLIVIAFMEMPEPYESEDA